MEATDFEYVPNAEGYTDAEIDALLAEVAL